MIPWFLGAAGFLAVGVRKANLVWRRTGKMFLTFAGLLGVYAYFHEYDTDYFLFFNMRFLTTLCALGGWYVYDHIAQKQTEIHVDEKTAMNLVVRFVTATLVLLLSTETYQFVHQLGGLNRADWLARVALSVIWVILAVAFLVIGFKRNLRWLRIYGLFLLGLTSAKLIFIDMAKLQDLYRIFSFFITGIFLFGASYLYHRMEKKLASREKEQK